MESGVSGQWITNWWPFALAFTALVIVGIPEAIALRTREHGITFSRYMWHMHQTVWWWTLTWGMLIGGLAVHFLWHWCPELGIGIGG